MNARCKWHPECGCEDDPCFLEDNVDKRVWCWRRAAGFALACLIGYSIMLILAGALYLMLAVVRAEAHDAMPTAVAPKGWTYPYSCCSGYDCREVSTGPTGIVRERPEGYVIAKTGEVIGYQDKRIKESPDGLYHWCSVAGADDGRTICLFAPPRSY
jgi:hypothetical protein